MRRWLAVARGAWRLRLGYCPLCNSSPPGPDCPVCRGWRDYGSKLLEPMEKLWWRRYLRHLDRT